MTNAAALESVRTSIHSLQVARAKLANAPRPLVEAAARVTEWLDFQESRFAPALGAFRAAPDGDARIEFNPALTAFPPRDDLVPLLVASNRRAVEKLLLDKLRDQEKTDEPGLPAEQRAARLAELDASILELEQKEEALIRSAERLGESVDRRPDADPRAVLAFDRELGKVAA